MCLIFWETFLLAEICNRKFHTKLLLSFIKKKLIFIPMIHLIIAFLWSIKNWPKTLYFLKAGKFTKVLLKVKFYSEELSIFTLPLKAKSSNFDWNKKNFQLHFQGKNKKLLKFVHNFNFCDVITAMRKFKLKIFFFAASTPNWAFFLSLSSHFHSLTMSYLICVYSTLYRVASEHERGGRAKLIRSWILFEINSNEIFK